MIRLVQLHTVLIILLIPATMSAQKAWELKKDKGGIEVYFREAEDSNIKELKVVTRVRSSLGGAVQLVNDASNFSNWVYKCQQGLVLATFSETRFCYYNLTQFPWPFTNREFVLYCITTQDPVTRVVRSHSTASPDAIPLNPRYVRVQDAISSWTFRPLPDGEIDVEYYLKADPGGSIPAFLVNFALDIGPTKSFEKFKEKVESDEYRNMRLPYIREVGE